MADRIRINGVSHSWGSVKLKIAGERMSGISSITFGDKLEPAKGYGMGKSHAPRARSRGKYTTEPVKMKAQKSTSQEIRQMLADRAGGNAYGVVDVPIVVQFLEKDETPITVVLEACRLVENAESHEESADVLTDELTWDTMKIRRNGLTLFDESRT